VLLSYHEGHPLALLTHTAPPSPSSSSSPSVEGRIGEVRPFKLLPERSAQRGSTRGMAVDTERGRIFTADFLYRRVTAYDWRSRRVLRDRSVEVRMGQLREFGSGRWRAADH
jgi:hypothetical protein